MKYLGERELIPVSLYTYITPLLQHSTGEGNHYFPPPLNQAKNEKLHCLIFFFKFVIYRYFVGVE